MIKLINLHKAFGPKIVLNGITTTIPTGETVCIIGKSGCGKSVLLKHIVRLLTPDAGSVEVDGQDIATLNRNALFALRRRIGYVFQGAALFDSMTVYGNIITGLYEHGQRDESVLDGEARRTLSAVGLLPDISESGSQEFEKEYAILRNKKPSDLSGGMRKRVGVARALVGSPDYIFYDEPTTGLDPVTSEQIDNLIAELARKFKITSVVITHDMFSVFRIADRVIMLDGGKVYFEGSGSELRSSDDRLTREFIERYTRRWV
ncbi:ABC transporter ATP-binding protein [Ignavibacteria bacterium]|nr:ATP-binding cassette domain-containing protein [Bacteroidota bacterium]MCZ2133242.1 ATP-binding cassette domain-containing protein [Bacteroidota bacterium]